MPNVFISYSRLDREFVRRLHDALVQAQRDAWVDWESIPPTSEWLAAVYAGIEASDTFVFVLSPDSVVSKVCRLEVAHAVENRKRLVPILHRDVDAAAVASVSPALAAHNWLLFRDSDDFESSIARVLDAVDTDLDWLRAHTRLLVRAIEWTQSSRDSSFLLRGRDLRTARQWLQKADADEKREPTPLHKEYIRASERDSIRRTAVTGVALAVLCTALTATTAAAIHQNLQARTLALQPSATPAIVVLEATPLPTAPPSPSPTPRPASPEEWVRAYYEAINQQRHDDAYRIFSRGAQNRQSYDDFRAQFATLINITVRYVDGVSIQPGEQTASLVAHTTTIYQGTPRPQTDCWSVRWSLVLEDGGWKRDGLATPEPDIRCAARP